MVEIVPITAAYIESFHRTLDFVARERRYLSFVQAPPLDSTRAFILNNIQEGYPQFVALSAGDVVGWCDVTPKSGPIDARVGVLGMGLLPQFRRQGNGTRLMAATLEAARRVGFSRVELNVYRSNTDAIRLYQKAGFVLKAVQPREARDDGFDKTLLVMALALDTGR
ncbi:MULTISPECIES: GNAT family N-acetyltransferase [Bradyrhizobium]|uniref:GNAT family N-acetyltransferase n=1 Tax=Bradyrhizobium denitrificans TaxID=2734912 RepID=A0ABS5G2C7_9BRAD|nr:MULTISPECIES: GNAT family N-acetyltransferase [Bradyrhizobium]MDU6248013.1 GNAT family N-acetyltransferase [Paeniclostridium sordellii]RTM02910.1 MAG: GNAT family N-acetyltransferase [Bradyrhizobiaceae bacterium]ABQ33088.1 putative acetyltransferase [Bradyrhizobium sp. BTAi1]MBR1135463.1 GNAT family N-acetyltransferase [Bradyrhizobium denitrificans]MCL8488766.1 GNAT family N-acetyltransferase [Bradyrhizobium denitrificans]